MKQLDERLLTLTTISDTEQENFKETLRSFPNEHQLLENLLTSYKSYIRSINDTKDFDLPILQLFFICLREFLISSQLMAQGHFSESFTIISRASEAVGYSVVIKQDSSMGNIWLTQSGSKEFKKNFGEPFPKGNRLLHPVIFHIYNTTRTYGSHANFGSTIHFTTHIENLKYRLIYCDFNDSDWIKRNLLILIHSFTEFLIVYRVLYKDKLEEKWKRSFSEYVSKWVAYRDANKSLFKT
jgi:hypothetical protein